MAKREEVTDSDDMTARRAPKRRRISPVDTANALNPEAFCQRYLNADLLSHGSNETGISIISLHFARSLKSQDLESCFNLIESTSRSDYEHSSWQWRPKLKRREMKEKEMRYLLVKSERNGFEGFLSVMITHDSVPVVPVLYIYEIHLIPQAREHGLGKHLIRLAEHIAQQAGLAKVMLTCFKSNAAALKFYMRLGYATDASSPKDTVTRHQTHIPDYVIMSIDLTTTQPDKIAKAATEVRRDG